MATGVDDSCYVEAEKIRADALKVSQRMRQATAVAIAMYNAYQVIKNYRKQKEIADRSLAISEALHNQLKTLYWPNELKFLQEFGMDGGEPIEEIDVVGKRYGGRLRAIVAKAYAEKIKEAKCSRPRYCTSSVDKTLQDLLQERASALANAAVLGQNIAFSEYRARFDANLKRRLQAIALGKGLTGQAASLMEKASRGLAATTDNLAGNILGAINDLKNASIDSQRYTVYDAVRRAGGTYEDGVRIENATLLQGQTQRHMNAAYRRDTHNDTRNVFHNGVAAGDNFTGTISQYQDYSSYLSNDGRSGSENNELGTTHQSRFGDEQQDAWNFANLGNADTVREGIVQFPVISGSGGYVEVDMSRFKLLAVDDREADAGGT